MSEIRISGMQEYIFWFFGINELIRNCSEYTILLQDLLRDVSSVAVSITVHEQAQ